MKTADELVEWASSEVVRLGAKDGYSPAAGMELRGLVAANGLAFKGKPRISTYADALRSADLITRQQTKGH